MKKIIALIFAAAMLFSLCSCNESGSASQTETTKPLVSESGDDRILGDWSGEQVTTQGEKLGDVDIHFSDDKTFVYKVKGDYNGESVESEQSGTYIIDVDVVTMTFKNTKVKNLKTGETEEETVDPEEYSSVSGTLTSPTDFTIDPGVGYTVTLKKK